MGHVGPPATLSGNLTDHPNHTQDMNFVSTLLEVRRITQAQAAAATCGDDGSSTKDEGADSAAAAAAAAAVTLRQPRSKRTARTKATTIFVTANSTDRLEDLKGLVRCMANATSCQFCSTLCRQLGCRWKTRALAAAVA